MIYKIVHRITFIPQRNQLDRFVRRSLTILVSKNANLIDDRIGSSSLPLFARYSFLYVQISLIIKLVVTNISGYIWSFEMAWEMENLLRKWTCLLVKLSLKFKVFIAM